MEFPSSKTRCFILNWPSLLSDPTNYATLVGPVYYIRSNKLWGVAFLQPLIHGSLSGYWFGSLIGKVIVLHIQHSGSLLIDYSRELIKIQFSPMFPTKAWVWMSAAWLYWLIYGLCWNHDLFCTTRLTSGHGIFYVKRKFKLKII